MGKYQNGYGNKCPICGEADIDINCNAVTDKYFFYKCPNCGKFLAPDIDYDSAIRHTGRYPEFNYDRHHLKVYLFYNKSENRPFLAPPKVYEEYDKSGFVKIYNLTAEMVENWYPKNFNDKIDKILLWIANQSRYMGDEVNVSIEDLCLLFFMYNKLDTSCVSHDWGNEFRFVAKYLLKNGFIGNYSAEHLKTLTQTVILQKKITFVLTETAWRKIYDLQKNQANNKDIFVAMSFHELANDIRRAIKQGIDDAEYSSLLMDEIVHNHQIVPEMLRLIKESRFMIMDITQPNFGAYYEAGYAQGLGKEVIITCSQEVWDKKDFSCEKDANCIYKQISTKPHFDIAQKQVLVWNDYADLTKKLSEWIKHLIG